MGMDIQSELTDAERAVVADRLLLEQRVRFGGVQKAAYVAAGINPTTWKRAVSGASVKPYKLVEIVTALWPESRGDWDAIPDHPAPKTTTRHPGPSWIGANGEPWGSDLIALKDYIDERADDLEERVRDLERMMLEAADPDVEIVVRPITEGTEPDADHTGDVDAQQAKTQARPARRRTGLG